MMYDLVVLGGGPGGQKAAELASARGMKVAVVEKDRLGGTCLNRGCIPTKALYAHIIGGRGEREGLWERVEAVVNKLRQGTSTALRMAKVPVYKGHGTVTQWKGEKKITVEKADGTTEDLVASRLLIATGARSVLPEFEGNKGARIFTGDWAITAPLLWDPRQNQEVKRVAVLGAGVIALEMAMMLQGLGKEVVLLKHSDQVLRRMDGDIKKAVIKALKERKTVMRDYVTLVRAVETEVGLSLSGTEKDVPFEEQCNALIVASSMDPILDGFGLERSSVAVRKGAIAVDEAMRTSVEGVYAIGDCTGGAMLAHLAEYQALAAVGDMTGDPYRVDMDALPSCIFIDPEVAVTGLTEEEAKSRGEGIVTAKAYFAANGMALALGEGDGFVKIVARASDRKILGVHIMGPEAASLLGEATLAVAKGMTAGEVARTVHAHPTLCECFRDACARAAEAKA